MIRMSNVSRHRPQDSLDWFYSEWHGEHVRLMVEAPGVMRLLQRYVQNRAMHDPDLPVPALPLGAEGWDSMSQLTFANVEDFIACFGDPSYIEKVRSHQFSDPAVIVSTLTSPSALIGSKPSAGVFKVTQFYQPNASASAESVFEALNGAFLEALRDQAGLMGVVRNLPCEDVSPEVFVGSRWEGVPFNQHIGFDELYFSEREALAAYLAGGPARQALDQIRADHLSQASFTFLCREIVQIDNKGEKA